MKTAFISFFVFATSAAATPVENNDVFYRLNKGTADAVVLVSDRHDLGSMTKGEIANFVAKCADPAKTKIASDRVHFYRADGSQCAILPRS